MANITQIPMQFGKNYGVPIDRKRKSFLPEVNSMTELIMMSHVRSKLDKLLGRIDKHNSIMVLPVQQSSENKKPFPYLGLLLHWTNRAIYWATKF